MTTPQERTSAILNTRSFLTALMLPPRSGGLAGVPSWIRLEARRLLKHYPMNADLLVDNSFDKQTALQRLDHEQHERRINR
jgi:hypothetical protein